MGEGNPEEDFLILAKYPKGEGGRPAYPLMAMLRVHLMQNWFGYSDPALDDRGLSLRQGTIDDVTLINTPFQGGARITSNQG